MAEFVDSLALSHIDCPKVYNCRHFCTEIAESSELWHRAALEQFWGSFRAALGHLWDSSGEALGHLWDRFGTLSGRSGALWGLWGSILGQLWEEGEEAEREREEEREAILHFYIHKLPINRPCGRYVIIIIQRLQ